MKNPYSTTKVIYHPELVEAFAERKSHRLKPHHIHLMPQNLCNQSCHFCSYRLEGWHNSELFNDKKHIPWPKMKEIVWDLFDMSVKAVEITGGGEPLAYPFIKELLLELLETNIELGLVTNATLLTPEVADILAKFGPRFKWSRVSIDSGCLETYVKVRRCPPTHWEKAWNGIVRLSKILTREEQILGIGYVVTDQNWEEVFQLCEMANDVPVDSVRVSVAFTPKGADILTKEEAASCQILIDQAKLRCKNIEIAALLLERLENLSHHQDYDYCGTKDLLCVIEGEQKVYTCCSLTGDPHGLIGSLERRTFKNLWQTKAEWRRKFDVREHCQCVCLYEKRNQTFLELRNPPVHRNFL